MSGVLDALESIANVVIQGGDDAQLVVDLAAALLDRLYLDKRDNAERDPDYDGQQFTGVAGRKTFDQDVGCESDAARDQSDSVNEQSTSERIVGCLDEEVGKSFQQGNPPRDILTR